MAAADRDRQREDFLLALYEATDGSTSERVLINDIGAQLGHDEQISVRLAEWLYDRGLIDFPVMGGFMAITPDGADEAEDLQRARVSDPYARVAGLLVTLSPEDAARVEAAAGAIQRALDSGELDTVLTVDDRNELEQVVVVLGTQDRTGRQRKGIVLAALAVAGHILGNVALGMAGNGAYDLVTALVTSL